MRDFYGEEPQQSPDYGRIVNRASAERLAGLLGSGKAVVGGRVDLDDLYVAPTVLVDVGWDSPIMQEEVFGPILPVLEIDSVRGAIDWVNGHPAPLHPLAPHIPFGGVGNSGMGKYHGRWGFEAFTNTRGVLYHSPRADPELRYPPYANHRLAWDLARKVA